MFIFYDFTQNKFSYFFLKIMSVVSEFHFCLTVINFLNINKHVCNNSNNQGTRIIKGQLSFKINRYHMLKVEQPRKAFYT